MTTIATVERLCKSYGNVLAIKDVDLEVQAGEALALLGPNGSGKTTILRCLAGLIRPDSGRIRICGRDVCREPVQTRRHFSYLPQKPNFPADLTVREVMSFHVSLRGAGQESVLPTLRQAGIGERDEDRRVSQLSGGTLQRLAVAVASAGNPELMLLDEPTASLDPEAALSLHNIAGEWRSQGRALLFSTHVLAVVEKLADRVLILVEGRRAALETVSRLREEVSKAALLRVEVARPTSEYVRVALERGASDARLNCHSLVITAPAEKRYHILEGLRLLGPINRFDTEEPSVESVYLKHVTGREENPNV
jgi:ABC-type multidrug transport system ATPase subunit